MMAQRDYRTPTGTRPERNGRGGRRGGLFSGLAVGVLLGLAVTAGLVWLFMPRAGDFKAVAPAPELRPPPAAIVTPPPVEAPAQAQAGDNTQYTFYQILPGKRTPRPLPPTKAKAAWWLQVAALKNEDEANVLKAKLGQLRLSVVVQRYSAGQDTLYRIRIGPFATEDEARPAQETLRVNKFEARLLKEAVTP